MGYSTVEADYEYWRMEEVAKADAFPAGPVDLS